MKRAQGQEIEHLIEQADSSLLDVMDHVLNQGVVITGDVILGLPSLGLHPASASFS